MTEGKKKSQPTSSFVAGAIAIVFLILGYEAALFVQRAASMKIAAVRDHPDTVFVVDPGVARELLEASGEDYSEPVTSGKEIIVRKEAEHPAVKGMKRRVESFTFNPNTISVSDLQRLGFSEKQALAIDNYRRKGGRFRRPGDFAKSFVVSDSVYRRLEPYIDIPRIDINKADSASLLALPGVGPYFAGKIVEYRNKLGGYSTPLQLLEIYRFDREKYDALEDLVTCSPPSPYPLWALPENELSRHPHISRSEAHGIVLYREHNPASSCTLEGLLRAGVLSQEHHDALSLCLIAPAE